MKCFVIIFVCALAATSRAAFTDEEKAEYDVHVAACEEEAGVTTELVKKLHKHEPTDNTAELEVNHN